MNKNALGTQITKYKYVFYLSVVLVTSYSFYEEFSNKEVENKWKQSDKEILDEKCMTALGVVAKNHPVEAKQYCECTTEIITSEYNVQEYLKVVNDTSEANAYSLSLLLYPCLEELEKNIK